MSTRRPALPVLGLAALAGAVTAYGSLWPITRIAVQHIPPTWYAVFRLGIAAAILFSALILSGRLRIPPRRDVPLVLSIGTLMIGLFAILFQWGLQYVEAGRGALLAYTTPLWVTPIAVLFLGERLSGARLAGLVVAMAGLVVLFNPAGFDWGDRRALMGNGAMVLAAMVWSGCILHIRSHRPSLTTLQLIPWQLGLGWLICLTSALVVEGVPDITWTTEAIAAVAYGGPIATALGFYCVTATFQLLPSTVSTVGMLAAPVMAVIISVAFMGEALTVMLAMGVVLVIGGVFLVSLRG